MYLELTLILHIYRMIHYETKKLLPKDMEWWR